MQSDAVLPAGLIVLLVLAAANTIHELINIEKKQRSLKEKGFLSVRLKIIRLQVNVLKRLKKLQNQI